MTSATANIAVPFEPVSFHVRAIQSETIQRQVAVSLGVKEDQIAVLAKVSEKKNSRIGLLEEEVRDLDTQLSNVVEARPLADRLRTQPPPRISWNRV